jgi:TatD DNase family protein
LLINNVISIVWIYKQMLCVGIDAGNAQAVVDIAKGHEGVYASVGMHPLDVGGEQPDYSAVRALSMEPEVVAIGETGLDYYYSEENKTVQQQSFIEHLQLSAECGKPVVVHTRDAREDTLAIIREYGDSGVAGVLHCFTESWEMARAALDLNYYISFSGIITFKNAAELREVVKQVPLERLLIETDSPYLAPVPYRGKKNEPKYVVEVAHCVAELKGVAVEEVAEITSRNFSNLFF